MSFNGTDLKKKLPVKLPVNLNLEIYCLSITRLLKMML